MINTHKLRNQAVLFFILLLWVPFGITAQIMTVQGTVMDEKNEPVIGASVLETGTTNGTVTDFDGKFTLQADANAHLTISYVGFTTQSVAIKGRKMIHVKLAESTQLLEETVVIGYGVMKKSDMTGAISSVNADELAKRPTTNPVEALQGKVSGVNIQKSGGNAGAGFQVKIRGVKTFGSNNPLYIIDGFPGDIDNVNPQDIASLEILKDGAAAAIYGSVAANGVIIVTTKNGKKGETKVDFSSYLTFSHVTKKLELLNADEYISVHKQMYENFNVQYPSEAAKLPAYLTATPKADTDWSDQMIRNGFSQNYMASVRGGSESARYSISYNHADDKGILLGNSNRIENARMKLFLTKYIFDFDANMSFKYTDNKQPQYALKEMYMISPLVPVYDESQKSGYGLTNFDDLPNNRNVMADHNFEKATDKVYNTTANIALTVNFTDWLNYKTSFSYRGIHERTSYHAPSYLADVKAPNEYPYYSEGTSYWQEKVFDNTLNFNKKFGDHNVNLMVGSSLSEQCYNWNEVAVEGKTTVYEVKDGKLVTNVIPGGFLDPNFQTINAGKGGTYNGAGSNWVYKRASFFGRVNYNYGNRYLVQATMRYDGSSKFGSNNRWGTFPSVALGWRIDQEEFFPENTQVSNLKLRGSWGRLGNEGALGYYDSQALIRTYNSQYMGYVQGNGENPWAGSIAPGLENRDLKWETTESLNIGLDYGFFNNKLYGAVNYYHNQTNDLLIYKALAPSAGLWNPILNVGKMRNKGVEIEINWTDKVGDWEYNVGLNLTTTHNEVTELADAEQVIKGEGLKYGTEHFVTQTRVGQPIGGFYLYRTDGIFQSDDEASQYVNKEGKKYQPDAKAGDIRFQDLNGDGVIDENDKAYCGSGIPKAEVNLNLGFSWKGLDFSTVIGSGWGHKLYNGNRYFYEGMNSGTNFLTSTLDAWTPKNTNTDVPRAVLQDRNGNTRESDRFLENGNFIRLRQLQIGYTLPSSLLKPIYVEKLRVYASGDNLLTWTNYSGIDPEFSNSNVLNTGIDRHIYPFTRSFTVGVQLTF